MTTLEDDNFIYKYMSLDSFLFTLTSAVMLFQKVKNWPDRSEGYLFEFCKRNGIKRSEYSLDDYSGSCWTRHTENSSSFENESHFQDFQEEVLANGSATMWASYCANGGVRIRSTIGIIRGLLSSKGLDVMHGQVEYRTIRSVDFDRMSLEDLLFIKNPAFRAEDEYRFLIRKKNQDGIVKIKTLGLRNFVDEIVICPNIASDNWKSRSVFKLVIDYLLDIRDPKDLAYLQNVRMSDLYSSISEEMHEIGEI